MPLHVTCRADDDVKHNFDVNGLLFHKNKLYSFGDDGFVKAWSTDLRLLGQVQAHPCSVFSVAIGNDSLYTSSNEGKVKVFDLETLKQKQVLLDNNQLEYWKLFFDNGILYIGDSEGNVKILKNGALDGEVTVAEPVKDMVVQDNLLLAVNVNDLVALEVILDGPHPQYGVKNNVQGRAPLAVLKNKAFYFARDGKELKIAEISKDEHIKEVGGIKDAHGLIVNAITTVEWGGQSLVFTGGWDKLVKQWKLENNSLKPIDSSNVEILVNAITVGEQGDIYAAGGDGHIVRLGF